MGDRGCFQAAKNECATRGPGQLGVRLRLYADLRQALPRPATREPSPPARSEAWSATTGE
ncbi:DUF6207 family protein [Streptomyces mirabilis]|uniref:DUF6207 family protein n=1 Tax=Streptomyces mirabilis TaxID=68239 RepID=UPI0036DAC05A